MPRRPLAVALACAMVACQQGAFSLPAVPQLPFFSSGPQHGRAETTVLTQRVNALVDAFDGEAAVWIADAYDPEPLYARNPDVEVVAASLYKLGVLVHVESLVEAGRLKLADSIRIEPQDISFDASYVAAGATVPLAEALELMITVSDNGTALALWRIHGAVAINTTLERVGLKAFRVGAPDEDSIVTASAVGKLLQRMAEGKLVSKAASARMLGRLERQTLTGRSDALLPTGRRVAHKTGDLPGLFHDAAVVFTPRGPRVVVVLTWDGQEDQAHELMAKVALAAFETAK